MDDRDAQTRQKEFDALYTLRKRFKLRDVRAGIWDACCPAHDDRNRSLRIYRHNERLYFRCYAGCSFNDVRTALGLTNWHGQRAIFRTDRKIAKQPAPAQICPYDFPDMANAFRASESTLGLLASELGVSVAALADGGVGWIDGARMYSHSLGTEIAVRAWAWPMVDGAGEVTGLRLRYPGGDKGSWTGSRPGLFTGKRWGQPGPVMIVEGPTDRAAAADWGYDAIGRPSCNDGDGLVLELLRKLCRRREVVVLAQVDSAKQRRDSAGNVTGVFYPGQDGAVALADAIAWAVYAVRIITPPPGIKDARRWLNAGGTRADVDRMIASKRQHRRERRTA